jgi:hypothetical protein
MRKCRNRDQPGRPEGNPPTAVCAQSEHRGCETPPSIKLVESYEPTAKERRALKAYRNRQHQQKLQIRAKATMTGNKVSLQPDHADAAFGQLLLMDSLGTIQLDFSDGLLAQLANAATKGQIVDEGQLNFMLAMVTGIEPRDQLEAMLAAQMAAVHNATMTFARRLNHVDNIQQQDSAERAFNKLARTFACQLQALKAYRSTGQQHVTVTHLNVAAHQAQVNVGSTPGGEGAQKFQEQLHAPREFTHEPCAPLPCPDPEREAVSVAGSAGETAL